MTHNYAENGPRLWRLARRSAYGGSGAMAIACSGPRTGAAVVDDEYGAGVWSIAGACRD